MSGHVHVCFIKYIKQVKENVRCEALLKHLIVFVCQ